MNLTDIKGQTQVFEILFLEIILDDLLKSDSFFFQLLLVLEDIFWDDLADEVVFSDVDVEALLVGFVF